MIQYIKYYLHATSILFCIHFIVFFPKYIIAQNIQYYNRYDITEGLLQNSIHNFYLDKLGYMWIFSADGAHKFDGNRLIKFPNIGRGNSSLILKKFFEDSSGNLWYNGVGKLWKLSLLDGSSKSYPCTNPVIDMQLDLEGNQWELVKDGRVIKHNYTKEIFPFVTNISYGRSLKYLTFSYASRYFYYIDEISRSLYYFDTKLTLSKKILDNVNFSASETSQKNLWLITQQKKLIELTPDLSITVYDISNNPPSLCNTNMFYVNENRKEIWFCDEYKIYKTAFNSKKIQLEYQAQASIVSLYIDNNENLFIGTDGAGASVIDTKASNFKKLINDNLFSNDSRILFVKNILEITESRLLINAFPQGLFLFNRLSGNFSQFKINVKSSLRLISDICYGKDSMEIFAGNIDGIYKIDIRSRKAKKIKSIGNIYSLCSNNEGFYASGDSGIYSLNFKTNNWKVISKDLDKRARSMFFDQMSNLWIGAETGTLYKVVNPFKKEGTVLLQKKFNHPFTINCFSEDKTNGSIWMGTSQGIYQCDYNGVFKDSFSTLQGLSNNYVYSIIHDSLNRLWVGTNNGLNCINMRDKTCRIYTFLDGIPSNEFNTKGYCKGRHNVLYFGTTKGLFWFNPDEIVFNHKAPKLSISRVIINDDTSKSVIPQISNHKLSLTYDENILTFQVGVLEFSSPYQNIYKYILVGVDKDWVSGNKGYEIRYSDLKPGDYTFQILGANNDGFWAEEPLKISIKISPPFWKTKAAYAIYYILIATIIYFLIRVLAEYRVKKRLRDLEKKIAIHNERQRLARDLHDGIGGGLTHILLQSKELENKTQQDEIINKRIKSINETSKNIINNIRDIVWILNTEDTTFNDLCGQIRDNISTLFEDSNVKIHFDIDYDENDILLSNKISRNIYFCITESLNNILKHAHASNAWLSIKIYSNKKIECVVVDDGIGLYFNDSHLGNGINNMHRRIEEINGEILFSGRNEKGTKINFSIPL